MSHFYGTLKGSRGEATRCGTTKSGLETWAAGWGGAVRVCVYHHDGQDWVRVTMEPWKGIGPHKLLYSGPLGIRMMSKVTYGKCTHHQNKVAVARYIDKGASKWIKLCADCFQALTISGGHYAKALQVLPVGGKRGGKT
jgi:hypothetical protein